MNENWLLPEIMKARRQGRMSLKSYKYVNSKFFFDIKYASNIKEK